jgi:tRNA U34 5-carboxymethylaminomethyl modifying enzyme MnmG/GidA
VETKLVALVYVTNPLTEHLDVHGMKLTPQHIVTKANEEDVTVYIRFELMNLLRHWLKAYPTFKKDTHTRGKLRKVLAAQLKEQDEAILEAEKTKKVLIISEIDFADIKNLTVNKLHGTIAKYLSYM